MRKLLFITFSNKQAYTGGGQGAKRNLKSLQDVFGKENVCTYIIQPEEKREFKNKVRRGLEILKGYMGGLTSQGLGDIIRLIRRENCTDLFIDSSLLGVVAKHARKQFPALRIYTFFQNIEFDFTKSNTIDCKDYLHSFWIPLSYFNESCACRYSDKAIVLNERDASRLKQLYHKEADGMIPVWMIDDYTDTPANNAEIDFSQKREALFVGSYFFGNTKGLKWFCNEVLPLTDLHLTIVGSGMEAFVDDIQISSQITIYDNVPDLVPYYEKADFVILPIVSGGGMKVKTAEALKYGKFIIGTHEALEGYQVNGDIATICTDKDSFISAIESFKQPYRFNEASRQLFKQKYSYNATFEQYKNIINQ